MKYLVTVCLLCAVINAAGSRPGSAVGRGPDIRIVKGDGMAAAARPPELRAGVGLDVLIHSGTVAAMATDYEMDGTMWAVVALTDSTNYLYKSTDHGLIWSNVYSFNWNFVMNQLGLVVGEGDSGFVHIFVNRPTYSGDLYDLRSNRDGSNLLTLPVAVGYDTILDFAVCRDYSGDNHWLYAVATNPDTIANSRALRFFRSSTYGREWAVTDSYAVQLHDPYIAFGAGSWCYFSAVSPLWMGGSVMRWMNRSWCSAGYWDYDYFTSDSDAVADPAIAPAFTKPESLAAVWCVYGQNFNNSGDWDVKYTYSTDGGKDWSTPYYLAGSSSAYERFPDLRNYTSPGNNYVNASYISEVGGDRRVYRQYTNGADPAVWSDTLRINEGNAGTGSEIRPKLCYTPGGPFSGAGCVFVGAGLNSCWWNAPYPTGVAELQKPRAEATRLLVQPSIGRGPFRVYCQESSADLTVHDRTGRLVRTLALDRSGVSTWDGRDGRGRLLPSGVYFCRLAAGDYRATEKVVLQR
jgi:hypothetical protein